MVVETSVDTGEIVIIPLSDFIEGNDPAFFGHIE
jgi:hypothetical protein